MNFQNCPYCLHKKLYTLKNNYLKCKGCNRKFSPNKIQTDIQIIHYFCNNKNALETSKILKINYRTVHNRYKLFRKLCASYLENIYLNDVQEKNTYEEYYYFTQRCKNKKTKSIYDAINIIGFYSNNKVYTLLMPPLPKPLEETEDKSFEKYLHWHKIYSADKNCVELKNFWAFLEVHLKKYKGITATNFFYYLKECEYKFNFTFEKQVKILQEIYLI